MKAAQYKTRGIPSEVIEVVEVDPRPLQPGDARVDVLAAPINPSDLLTLTGDYGILPPLPAIGGNEGVGRVVELSGDTGDLRVGQTVLLPAGAGTWQSQIVAPAAKLVPLPEGADPLQLAMLTINPPTAWLMLDAVPLEQGDWVVQNAANSAVGAYLIQLARRRGVRTANVVRRAGLEAALIEQGADAVFVDGPDLAHRIKAHTERGARLAIDAIGGDATSRLADSLVDGGLVLNYGALSGEPCQVSPLALIFRRVRLEGFWLMTWLTTATPAERADVYGRLTQLIADGTLHAPVEKTYPLEDARAAVAHAMQGGRNGKILITPNP